MRSVHPAGWLLALAIMTATGADAPAGPDAAERWFQDGVRAFFAADIPASTAAFDRVIALTPEVLPQLWQRGLVLYYAGRFADGRAQFERHQTVNPNDVENAAWHFLCVAKLDGVDAARKALIPIAGDGRVPMREVHRLFAGNGTAEEVLRAADPDGMPTAEERDHLCYAHLYLGLFYEATGNEATARSHMRQAAIDHRMDHYMGKVAQVHVKLRGWE
jgi:lipoprotein NlpI